MDEEFDFVGDYYYGLAPVRVGSKWGIINFSNDISGICRFRGG